MSTMLTSAAKLTLALAVTATLGGCAGPNPRDPYEGFNRAMFKFNDTVDQVALKPAATVYKNVLPTFVQTGVNNFFGNLHDVWSALNNLLQGASLTEFDLAAIANELDAQEVALLGPAGRLR